MAFGFSADDQDREQARQKRIREALSGMASIFKGEDDSCGLPDCFDGLAYFEPVDVTLNAGIIRAVLKAAEDVK